MPTKAPSKATLDAEARDELSDSDYAYVDAAGGQHLPVHDADHVRAALARFNQTEFEDAAAKKKAAKKILARAKKLGIEVSDDAGVATAAKSVAVVVPADDDADAAVTQEAGSPRASVKADLSLEDRRNAIYAALDELRPQETVVLPDTYGCYVEETYDDYVIVCCGPAYYKIPYTMGDPDADNDTDVVLAPRDQWQEVAQAWVTKRITRGVPVRRYGTTKDVARLGGWLVVFGGTDLVGDTFTAETNYYLKELGHTKPVFYDHTFNSELKNALLGTGIIEERPQGLWFQMELDRHNAYCDDILKLADVGALGLSSGTAEHLIRKDGGFIKSWPIVEGSTTPTPCEPRTLGLAALRSLVHHVDGLRSLLPEATSPSAGDPRRSPATSPPAAGRTVRTTSPEEAEMPSEVLDQLGALAEQMKAIQSQMDPISALLKRYEDEPQLRNAGFVSETGGTSDRNIKSFADWLMSVRRQDDTRLEKHYKSIKAALSESGGETGGYNVPTEYAQRLQAVAAEDSIVRSRAGLVYPMMHREVEIPLLDQFTAPSGEQSAFLGGVIAGWVEEAAALAETEPKFKLMRLIAHGLGGYTLASNDLRADSAEALDALLTTLFGRAIGWHEDYAFLRGDGVGKPLGALSWSGAIATNRHVASHFDLTDAGTMMARLTATSMKRAVWVMSQTVIPELVSLQASSFNAWIQQTATSTLQGSLLGLPIIYSEKLPPLGTSGGKDVALCDFGSYVVGDREGIEIAFSEHYKFVNRQGTWRFFCRRDGQPWLKSAITLADGTTTVSPFVYLGDHS